MSRRADLPGAAELFRPTAPPRNDHASEHDAGAEQPVAPNGQTARSRRSSGRQRHDEKITVYVSADELHALETARLGLRREHGVAVDRGRIVREAMAIILADLDHQGPDSVLVKRLRDN